jgi:hypothetical protein
MIGEGYILNCIKCGLENKVDATYCKKCGADLKEKENVIILMNSKINLLAVFIGLIISILVLFTTTILLSGLVVSKAVPLAVYVLMIIVAMAFFGSILTGALGCKNVNDGYINGGFLSLIILVLVGLMIGIAFLAVVGSAAEMVSAFGPATSSLGSGTSSGALSSLNGTTSLSSTSTFDWVLYFFEFVAAIVLILVTGAVGGASGVYIKKLLS